MCSQGYPAVDIFDLTGATPHQPTSAADFDYSVFKPMEKVLKHYFETRTSKRCLRDKVFKKIKDEERPDLPGPVETAGSGSGSGTEESSANGKEANAKTASSTNTEESQ